MDAAKTILVVDDEANIVQVVKSYLEKNGYSVYEAYNGQDALAVFGSNNITLVILDLMLPDMTGEELCTTIRKKSRAPIIMLTATHSGFMAPVFNSSINHPRYTHNYPEQKI